MNINSEIFSRAVEDIVTRDELKKLLASGRSLRIKHGIDATSPDLHLGHAASLWKLRALQEAGHRAVILLGDVTTTVGDPTGRKKARPVLSQDIIARNIVSIQSQVEQILITDKSVYEVHRSGEWYEKMSVLEFLRILSFVTHARLIERDMFQERIRSREEIFMHELVYPLLQGYDSVMLKSDITIIGSDQLFNEHIGRFLQEKCGKPPQVIVTLTILSGPEGGEKMSKSAGNYIGLPDSPQDKFGKAMRVLDSLIVPYLTVYTDMPLELVRDIQKELHAGRNPIEAKLAFAESLVARYHGKKIAAEERDKFITIFSRRLVPHSIPAVNLRMGEWKIIDLLRAIQGTLSKSEARRLVNQGAVEVNGKVIRDVPSPVRIAAGTVIRVGKKTVVKVKE